MKRAVRILLAGEGESIIVAYHYQGLFATEIAQIQYG